MNNENQNAEIRGLYQDEAEAGEAPLQEEQEVTPIREKPEKPRLTPEERKKKVLKELREWVVSLAVAVLAVLVLKNYLFMPITVDGSSMKPTLESSDRLFVTAYDVNIVNRLERGDVVICHYPGRTSKHSILRFLTVKTDFVKRLVGMPGDTVSRVQGVTYINGTPLDPRSGTSYSATYTKDADGTLHFFYNGTELTAISADDGSIRYAISGGYSMSQEALTARYKFDYSYVLGENEYFVVGDNRYNSHDSRAWNGPDLYYRQENNVNGDVGPLSKSMIAGRVKQVFWPLNRWQSVSNNPDYVHPSDVTE